MGALLSSLLFVHADQSQTGTKGHFIRLTIGIRIPNVEFELTGILKFTKCLAK